VPSHLRRWRKDRAGHHGGVVTIYRERSGADADAGSTISTPKTDTCSTFGRVDSHRT
jgi:hypothetical protein